jgi:hypothetical protein
MVSKTDIAILFVVVLSALCLAVYEAWLDPFQAIAVLVVMVGIVFGLAVFA